MKALTKRFDRVVKDRVEVEVWLRRRDNKLKEQVRAALPDREGWSILGGLSGFFGGFIFFLSCMCTYDKVLDGQSIQSTGLFCLCG